MAVPVDWYTISWLPPLLSSPLSKDLNRGDSFVCMGMVWYESPKPSEYHMSPLSYLSLKYYYLMFHIWISHWSRHCAAKHPSVQPQGLALCLTQWCLHEYFVKLTWPFERAGYVHSVSLLLATKKICIELLEKNILKKRPRNNNFKGNELVYKRMNVLLYDLQISMRLKPEKERNCKRISKSFINPLWVLLHSG